MIEVAVIGKQSGQVAEYDVEPFPFLGADVPEKQQREKTVRRQCMMADRKDGQDTRDQDGAVIQDPCRTERRRQVLHGFGKRRDKLSG